MKILLTGATGYIGKRLLPLLVNKGYQVVCCVRDKSRFYPPHSLKESIEVVEVDLLDPASLERIPRDIEGAYYLVHSMSVSADYDQLEHRSAANFREAMDKTAVRQVIYLSGMANDDRLSKHLQSRRDVETELSKGNYHLTTFRAGIIIGSGSASFEIIRDLVEKLPVMIAPKWLNTKCQPVGIKDVLNFISRSLFEEKTYDRSFDIGGPDVLTYHQMLLDFARIRGLKRKILIVPVMTPRLSSYWLYFVTSISYRLAVALVDSMKVEVVCRKSEINELLDIKPLSFKECLKLAFDKIESNAIISSWKDSMISGRLTKGLSEFINVPTHGCFIDRRTKQSSGKEATIRRIWQLGGDNGWYYVNFLWKIRGFLDKMAGGVGLRRGRTHPSLLHVGDALDFWRVLYADEQVGRLLLFAEMKLPGEAWLEFKFEGNLLIQTATFRPRGIAGRLYWYSIYPFHGLIFNGMLKRLAGGA